MHPPKYPLPSSSAFLSIMIQGLDPNDRPDIDLTNSASPEGWRVHLPNCLQTDTGCIIEESPEEVGSQFGWEGGHKVLLQGLYDQIKIL